MATKRPLDLFLETLIKAQARAKVDHRDNSSLPLHTHTSKPFVNTGATMKRETKGEGDFTLPRLAGSSEKAPPKFADGDHVCVDRWTETVTGTVDGAPWLEERTGVVAGFWYTLRLADSSYTYVHESRLSDAGLVRKTHS